MPKTRTTKGPAKPSKFIATLIVEKDIVFVTQRPGSKWLLVWCSCNKKRKDGTCNHAERVIAGMKPEYKKRAKVYQKQT